jgi:hypothetical protein
MKVVLTGVLTPDSRYPRVLTGYSLAGTSNAMTRVKNRRSDAETIVYLQVGMPKWECLSGNA